MIKGQFKNQVYSRRGSMSSRGRSPSSKARHAIRHMCESRKDAIDAQAQASEQAAQVANVERGAPLPPRRSRVSGEGSSAPASKVRRGNPTDSSEPGQGSGSHAPSFEEEIQLEEDIAAQQAAQEEGPFFITTPSRDPNYHRRVIRWNRKWTEVEKERKKDPYKFQQLSTDPRFWNLFQQDYYETVFAPKKGAILMQWVDWKYMEELHDSIIDEVIEACAQQNLKELMGLQYPWCKEIIAQFYATVYFEPNKEKTIHWMTDGIIYSVTYAKFAAILGFPARSRTNRVKIHDEKPMDTNSLHFLYQDVDYELGTIKGLLPFYAYLNKLLRKTLNPKEGDASNVLAYTSNLLYKIKAHP